MDRFDASKIILITMIVHLTVFVKHSHYKI